MTNLHKLKPTEKPDWDEALFLKLHKLEMEIDRLKQLNEIMVGIFLESEFMEQHKVDFAETLSLRQEDDIKKLENVHGELVSLYETMKTTLVMRETSAKGA
ncbi:MAG: hypothetical protein ACQEQL_04445 [Pseudomonadota bacterium]